MTSKVQFYSAMASYTATHLTDSWQRWTAFLTTASRLYKYPFLCCCTAYISYIH